MTTQDDLEQLLWDYVYGLLEPADARALEARITSEHDVAKAYAEVRQRADLLATAASLHVAPVSLRPPQEAAPGESVAKLVAAPAQRGVTWFLASAALVLVALMGYAWQRHGWLHDPDSLARVEQELAADYQRVIVTGPAAVQPDTVNLFTVQLQNLDGAAVEGTFAYALTDSDGRVLEQQTATANAAGVGQMAIDGSAITTEALLNVWCPSSSEAATTTLDLVRAEPLWETYLACNKPSYQPGETVYYRTVTLPALSAQDRREFYLNYAALAPHGRVLEQAAGLSQQGVGNGSLTLPEDAVEGRYVLRVDSPQVEQVAQQVEFDVQRGTHPWRTNLVVLDDRLAAGDVVSAEIEALQLDGAPLKDATVAFQAQLNGEPLAMASDAKKTDSHGKAELRFQLPESKTGRADLFVTVAKGTEQVTLSRSYFIEADEQRAASPRTGTATDELATGIRVRLVPEGGALVAGIANNVYVEATDAQNQPVVVNGTVVDSDNRKVAEVATSAGGRGTFCFTPEPAQTYHFVAPEVALGDKLLGAITPLATAEDLTSKLSASSPIVAAGRPIELEVATTKTPAQLLVAASCRGHVVGQQFVDFTAQSPETATRDIELAISDQAAGVIDVSLYDLQESPPQRVAQRPFFRAPTQYLALSLEQQSTATTGDVVVWTVRVRDEHDRPRAAVLGVSVVAEPAAPHDAPQPTLMASWFESGSAGRAAASAGGDDLSGVGEFSRNFASFGAPVRRPSGMPIAGGMGGGGLTVAGSDYGLDGSETLGVPLSGWSAIAPAGAAAPPAIADNLPTVAAAYQRAVTEWRDQQQERLQAFALAICGLSLALLFALALLATLQIAGRPYGWLPALTACTAALAIGGNWLGVRLEGPVSIAARAIAQYDGGAPASVVNEPAPVALQAKVVQPESEFLGRSFGSAVDAPLLFSAPVAGPALPGQLPALEESLASDHGPSESAFIDLALPASDEDFFFRRGLAVVPADAASEPAWAFGNDNAARSKLLAARELIEQQMACTALPVHRYGEVATFGSQASGDAAEAPGTLYWNPLLRTNPQGEAHIRFRAPAGTRYRIVIDAHGDGRIGSFERTVDSTPLHALPAEK